MLKYIVLFFMYSTLSFSQEIQILEDIVDNTTSVEHRNITLKITLYKCRLDRQENCVSSENNNFISEARKQADIVLMKSKEQRCGQSLKVNEVMLSVSSSASGYQKPNEIDFISVTFTFKNLFKCVIKGSEEDDADLPIFQL